MGLGFLTPVDGQVADVDEAALRPDLGRPPAVHLARGLAEVAAREPVPVPVAPAVPVITFSLNCTKVIFLIRIKISPESEALSLLGVEEEALDGGVARANHLGSNCRKS